MSELHPGGLRFVQPQFRLKVLVHHVNHAVANAPEEEQRGNQNEGDNVVFAVRCAEQVHQFLHDFLWIGFAVYHRNTMGKQAVSVSSEVKPALF
jgi:hypothetical protein